MDKIIPRVAAVHDISGFGRCSLTVIIPVLSSMGIQVCPLPTAILSTHTDGYKNFFFHDFTCGMRGIAEHWKSEGIEFDCLYSGFLGSAKQIAIVSDIIHEFKSRSGTLAVVDPVMGDHGKLYKTYTREMQDKMRLLVEKADIITPNLTEACFLLGEAYTGEPLDAEVVKSYLKRLSDMGPESVVITSTLLENSCYANAAYNRRLDTYWKISYSCIPKQYPGTGDTFTSVLVGGLLAGDSLAAAVHRATGFVEMAIRETFECGTPEREGILLEKVLGWLRQKPSASSFEEF
ncbi:MAG: pyridoxamine kinase [Clostridia bacterium]|nr:pyridoxamine kinase [Clostridia bacterium]